MAPLLEGLIRGALDHPEPRGIAVERAAPRAAGAYRIDVLRLTGRSDDDTVARVAAAAAALPEIAAVDIRTPSVFVTPTRALLAATVLPRAADPYADPAARTEPWIVCFANPNANKPLHTGHLRICFIGMAMARMLEDRGHPVVRCQMVSDYGIHIAQAVVAYRRWGDGGDPTRAGLKPDLYVGLLYARFHQESAASPETAEELRREAADTLRAIEAGDPEVATLNRRLTDWAIDGIDRTYRRIGTSHTSEFYETETLPVGRQLIEEAVTRGVFSRRDDGSVVADLSWVEAGTVTLVRNDDTPLVFTQLLGSWLTRDRLYPRSRLLVVTGEQWKAGNDAMKEVLHRCGYVHASEVTEPHYVGMVRTPEGAVSSRKRNAPTADEVLDRLAAFMTEQCLVDFGAPMPRYLARVAEQYAIALLKYSLLRIRRGKPVVFDESTVTGADYTRFRQVVRVLADLDLLLTNTGMPAAHHADGALLVALDGMAGAVARACDRRDPSELVRYGDALASSIAEWRAAGGADPELAAAADAVLRRCFALLDIALPPLLDALPR